MVMETHDGVLTKETVKIQFIMQLTRSKTNKVIAGVCGGLEKSTGINAWLFRLVFFFGSGFWIYILMWAFIKEEQ